MEVSASAGKRILESVEEATSPQRILVRSLLKGRNALRAKYRELRAECKRWRNQAAAVEKSRATWRRRALAAEADLRDQRAAIVAQSPLPSVAASDPKGVEKKGR